MKHTLTNVFKTNLHSGGRAGRGWWWCVLGGSGGGGGGHDNWKIKPTGFMHQVADEQMCLSNYFVGANWKQNNPKSALYYRDWMGGKEKISQKSKKNLCRTHIRFENAPPPPLPPPQNRRFDWTVTICFITVFSVFCSRLKQHSRTFWSLGPSAWTPKTNPSNKLKLNRDVLQMDSTNVGCGWMQDSDCLHKNHNLRCW